MSVFYVAFLERESFMTAHILEREDRVTVTAMSLVTKDIRQPGVYSSGTPLMENRRWHRANARYRSLEDLAKRVARLEKDQS